MTANQNAHAFGLSSTVAMMKMKTRPKSLAVAMTKIMIATRHLAIHHELFWSSSWLFRSCPLWPSTSQMTRTDRLVLSRGLCSGATRLVQIVGHHKLEVQSWDRRRSLGLRRPSEPSPSARLPHLWVYELSSFCLFSLPCVRSRELLQSLLKILVQVISPHERMAMKQQSTSVAERR